jgi:hypothetical protein
LEQEKPRPEKPVVHEPLPDVVEREDVRVTSSPVRCPFCHSDVAPEDTDWVACKSCLARHHTGCWGEAGRCGTCQSTKFLPSAPGRGKKAAQASQGSQTTKQVAIVMVGFAFIIALMFGPFGPLSRRRNAELEKSQAVISELENQLETLKTQLESGSRTPAATAPRPRPRRPGRPPRSRVLRRRLPRSRRSRIGRSIWAAGADPLARR